jgi:hypothetical protein
MQRASSLLRSRAPVESTKYQSVPYSPRFKPSLAPPPFVTIDLPSPSIKVTESSVESTQDISQSLEVPVIGEPVAQIQNDAPQKLEIEPASVDETCVALVQLNHDAPMEYDCKDVSSDDRAVEVARIQSSISDSHSTPLTSHAGTPLLERNVSSEFFLSEPENQYLSVDVSVDAVNDSHQNIAVDSPESEELVESATDTDHLQSKPMNCTRKQKRPRAKKVYLGVKEFAQSVLSSALSTISGFLLLQLPRIQSSAQVL